MEDAIINWCDDHDLKYLKIESTDSLAKIHNLLIKDIFSEPVEIVELIYTGGYFRLKQDPEKMMKFFLIAVDKGNSNAMVSIGWHYYTIKDYENMKKFYLMAVKEKNSISMNKLGNYYHEIEDYENMMKYFLMSIENGNSNGMNCLG